MAYELNEEQKLELLPVEGQTMEVDSEFFTAIEKLTEHGITAEDVEKLKAAGIFTCDILVIKHMDENLIGIEDISDAQFEKITEVAALIVKYDYLNECVKQKAVPLLADLNEQAEYHSRFDEIAEKVKKERSKNQARFHEFAEEVKQYLGWLGT